MIDERVYKPAMSVEEALAELRRCAGTQFDPHLVEVFCRLVTQRMALERVGSPA
jgi:HD-GYP domain-containing protein (c-di-GMP phosphodiesterase class II)